jgi:hypothetical protein
MLLEAEINNKYFTSGYEFGAISNLITWFLKFFLSADDQQVATFSEFFLRQQHVIKKI